MAVKYIVGTVAALAVLGAFAFVGSGYLHTRSVERKADREREAVHAMTQQDLAAAIARCDAVSGRDAAYCEAVAREMDNRPLEIVKRSPPVPDRP